MERRTMAAAPRRLAGAALLPRPVCEPREAAVARPRVLLAPLLRAPEPLLRPVAPRDEVVLLDAPRPLLRPLVDDAERLFVARLPLDVPEERPLLAPARDALRVDVPRLLLFCDVLRLRLVVDEELEFFLAGMMPPEEARITTHATTVVQTEASVALHVAQARRRHGK